jgi:hypothetical protein
VYIQYGDEERTTAVTRYGSYEFLVIPFGLCNAPTTFYTWMNAMFKLFLDKFVVVYLDDIVVYRESMDAHKKHLEHVFEALRQNKVFLKKSKCVFGKTKILFLGHWIGKRCIHMDPVKVKEIEYWEEPWIVHDMRVFIGI